MYGTRSRGFPWFFAAARNSVEKLEALKPSVAVTGHGLPMTGELLTESLRKLVDQFDEIAIPHYGKYTQ